MDDNDKLQDRVDSLTRLGIVFAIVWLAGIGSVIAFVSGLKAKQLIDRSDGELDGMGRAWFCIVLGAVGMGVWIPVLAVSLMNQF